MLGLRPNSARGPGVTSTTRLPSIPGLPAENRLGTDCVGMTSKTRVPSIPGLPAENRLGTDCVGMTSKTRALTCALKLPLNPAIKTPWVTPGNTPSKTFSN